MAEKRARHAFGESSGIEDAKRNNKIDSFDILFLDGSTEPKIGWLDSKGNTVIIDHRADLAKVETELEGQIATKADAKDVTQLESAIATKVDIDEVEVSYEKIKYEITDVPVGTLVNLNEREIRIMCPENSIWTKQTVGVGGDPNSYYMTFKTYAPNDNVVGYKEHLGNQSDKEILTDLKTDKYGRRYQPTWLALAKYDESTDTWIYHGKNSSKEKFVGWDYQIDWFDANGVMIASDCIRINLSNEECHSSIKPYYGVSETEEIEIKVEEVVEGKIAEKVEEAVATSNAYTDAQIEAKIAEIASAYEIVEF